MRPTRWRYGLETVGCLFVMGSMGLSGCHGSWPFSDSASVLNNSQFMEGWTTYLHCRSSVQPDEIRTDVQQLSRMAYTVATQNRASIILPASMRGLVMPPPSRLAVDPHAMMVACAKHGSEVAQFVGRPELAVELFTVVLAALREGVYAYHPMDIGRAFNAHE